MWLRRRNCPVGIRSRTPVVNDHGIATPTQRIKNLQELAKKAPETTDPGQRESICQELAQQIRKEPDSVIRGEILRTLAAYGGPTADAVLHLAVKDTDADVRVIVCDLWGKRSDAEAAQVLADVLASDSDRDVRMAAARGLGHSHDPAAVQALGTALDDTDPAMRYRAMVALQRVDRQGHRHRPQRRRSLAAVREDRRGAAEVAGASESSGGIIRSGFASPRGSRKPREIAVFESLLSVRGRCLLIGLLQGCQDCRSLRTDLARLPEIRRPQAALALPRTARIRTIR